MRRRETGEIILLSQQEVQVAMTSAQMDIVFTWVDDRFDGYADTMQGYMDDVRDTNPNRTRDNLDLLKYALRSVEENLPEFRRVYLLSCRPQVPDWMRQDHPDLRLVHHDEIMDPAILPTYNSFAIVSHLHLLPDLSETFLYLEDDMLIRRRGLLDALHRSGMPLSLFKAAKTRRLDELDTAKDSPWNLAMGTANAALAREFADRPRQYTIHGPRLFHKAAFADMVERFSPEITDTRASRFRSGTNVPSEYLYPHYAVEQGEAVAGTQAEAKAVGGYASLENFAPWTWWQLQLLKWRDPFVATLNDSFEHNPNPRVEKMVRNWLETSFPVPSRFER